MAQKSPLIVRQTLHRTSAQETDKKLLELQLGEKLRNFWKRPSQVSDKKACIVRDLLTPKYFK